MHSRLQYFLQKHNYGIRSFTLWNPDYPKIPLQFLIALDDQKVGILLPGVCLTNIWLSILLLQCESCTLNHPMHNLKTTRSMKRETQQLSLFSFWFYESKFSPNTKLIFTFVSHKTHLHAKMTHPFKMKICLILHQAMELISYSCHYTLDICPLKCPLDT
jgi:hypothetical protein